MAKLLKLRRGTTTQHGSFTGAEGEVTVDTDKESLVVHNGSNAGGFPIAREDMSNVSSANIAGRLGTDAIAPAKIAAGTLPTDVTIASANIVDGAIVNADVSNAAAIAGTKISPNFGSQNITTTGDATINGGDLTVTGGEGTSASLKLVADQGDDNGDGWRINSNQDDNDLTFANNTSGSYVDKLTLKNDGNLDVTGGADVTGNITVTGTVDGRDVAADGTKLDGIETNATADQTAAEILTAIKTVDGPGSGLNADHLDGITATSFLRSDANDTMSSELTFTSSNSYPIDINGSNDGKIVLRGSSNPYIRFRESNTDKAYIQWHSDGYLQLRNAEDGAGIKIKDDLRFSPDDFSNNYKIWHEGNDGAGSGLDADELDGIAGSGYLRSNTNDTFSGILTLSNTGADTLNFSGNSTDDTRGIAFNGKIALSADYNDGYLRINQGSEFTNGTYTPSLIRADGGFWVDGTSKGVNGSGNFVGGTIAGASDYATLLRANTSDTMSGNLTVTGHVTVGSGANSSDIYMNDSDETTRRIHCNSSRLGFLKSDNNWGCYADNSGNWTAVGNVTAYSDARLKTNVNTINDALSIVGKLRGVSFDWKADGKHSIGLIAQEVNEVLPELVVTNKGVSPVTQEIEDIKSVDYGKIVGVLINAVNELKAEVEELKGGK